MSKNYETEDKDQADLEDLFGDEYNEYKMKKSKFIEKVS